MVYSGLNVVVNAGSRFMVKDALTAGEARIDLGKSAA
jgi:hypothetical protein